MRARLIYSKRGGACFVPHIALAQLFSRSAVRAGLKLIMTQGFSPRAKISFGPELPAGVVALNEPVDMFFAENYENINLSLPEGFSISKIIFPEENSPSIGKLCTHAEYFARLARCDAREKSLTGSKLSEHAKNFFAQDLLIYNEVDDWLKFIIKSPAQNPIGGFVKYLIGKNIISGWHEINLVRSAIGQFNGENIYLS